MVDKGFVKAQSDNLPKINTFMVASFIASNKTFVSAEMRGVKMQKSGREEYGDQAIGYVQIKRDEKICTIKAKITPEHRVRSKSYQVTVECDEEEENILRAVCDDCAAKEGGCKHIIAMIMWAHRRSEEPACTEVKCYWAKSKLSSVGTSFQFIEAKKITKKNNNAPKITDGSFLNAVVSHCEDNNVDCQLMNYFGSSNKFNSLCLNNLINKFIQQDHPNKNYKQFLRFAESSMDDDVCLAAADATKKQSDSALWKTLRYGRITASKAHEASKCQTADGVLVEIVLGAYLLKDTFAIKRGKQLETEVIKEVEKLRKIKISKCGLFLSKTCPLLGASPDGITEKYVVEIKCPVSEKTAKNYVSNGKISPRCNAQVQLQMFMTHKRHALFCIASPEFEKTKNVSIVEITYDAEFCKDLVNKCERFWERCIFEKLF